MIMKFYSIYFICVIQINVYSQKINFSTVIDSVICKNYFNSDLSDVIVNVSDTSFFIFPEKNCKCNKWNIEFYSKKIKRKNRLHKNSYHITLKNVSEEDADGVKKIDLLLNEIDWSVYRFRKNRLMFYQGEYHLTFIKNLEKNTWTLERITSDRVKE
jgi:hypothetical protein